MCCSVQVPGLQHASSDHYAASCNQQGQWIQSYYGNMKHYICEKCASCILWWQKCGVLRSALWTQTHLHVLCVTCSITWITHRLFLCLTCCIIWLEVIQHNYMCITDSADLQDHHNKSLSSLFFWWFISLYSVGSVCVQYVKSCVWVLFDTAAANVQRETCLKVYVLPLQPV